MAQIKKLSTELQPLDKLLDSSGDAGTSGQILSSTGSGTNWISASSGTITGSGTTGYIPKWTGSSALGDSILEVNSSFPNDVLMPQYLRHRGDTNTYFGFYSNDTFIVATSNNEAIRVNASGALLVNRTSPDTSSSRVSVYGMSEFQTTLTNNDDWQNSPVSILERDNVGSGSTANKYAPNLNFHWAGITSKSLWMGADGHLSFGEYQSNGNPTAGGTFVTGSIGVGVDNTTPEAKLTVKGDPGNTNQPTRITNNSTDTHTGLFLNGIGNAVNEKYGLQFGGYNEYSIGGIFGIMDSTSASTSGDITIDFGNGTSAGALIEKVRFTHEGNVGIGTASPATLLEVSSASSPNLRLQNTSSNGANSGTLEFREGDTNYGAFVKYNGDANIFQLGTRSSGTDYVRMTIVRDSGYIGIGLNSPPQLFTITGDANYIAHYDGSNYAFMLGADSSGDGNFELFNSSGTKVIKIYAEANSSSYINNGGNFGIGLTGPNERLEVSGNIRASGSYKVGATEVISSGRRFFAADGSGSAPAYSFSGRTDTGMYAADHSSNDRIWFTVDGTNRVYIDGNGLSVAAGNVYIPSGNSVRNYSGVWQATTGTSGNGFIFTNTADSSDVLSITSSSSGATASVATFGGKARSQQTASGDDATTLTTKSYVDGLVTGVTRYMGLWDASDGTGGSPDLTANTYKVPGYYFIVSVAGDAEPNGAGTEPDTWHVGDWVIWSDQATDAWQKIDNTSVLSGTGTANKLALWNGNESLTDSRFSQNATTNIITGPGSSASDKSLSIVSAANTEQLYIQGTGEVVVTQNYFYVSASQGAYINGILRARSGVTDDGGTLGLGGNGEVDNLVLTSNTSATFAGQVIIERASSNSQLKIKRTTSATGEFNIYTNNDSLYFHNVGQSTYPLIIDSSDDATFGGDLTVNTANATLNLLSGTNGNSTINFGDPADNNPGQIIYRHNGNSMSFDTADSERMRITSAGLVGIGTASPGKKLHVYDANAAAIKIQAGDANQARLDLANSAGAFGLITSGGTFRIYDDTDASERLRIDTSGNFGIGTTSPSSFNSNARNLVVNSSGNTGISIATTDTNANSSLIFADGTGGTAGYRGAIRYKHNGDYMQFDTSASERMRITSAGFVGIGTASPSTKLHVYNGEVTIASSTDGVKLSYSNGNSSGIIDTAFSDNNLEFRTNGTAKMWIANDGKVGIGTTSPERRLTVGDGSGSEIISIYAGNTNASALHFTDTNTSTDYQGFVSYNHNVDALRFGTAEVERMRISSDGYLGINTTLPVNPLHVEGNFTLRGNQYMGDDEKIILGLGSDLQIYHKSSNDRSYIYNGTGDLYIENDATDGDIKFLSDDGSGGTTEYFRLDGGDGRMYASREVRFNDDVASKYGNTGDLGIFHNGTNSYLENNTGELRFINNAVDKSVMLQATSDGSGSNVTESYLSLLPSFGSGAVFIYKDVLMAQDDTKIRMGSSQDLEIYHDGSNSYIKEQGAGVLYIQGSGNVQIEGINGENMIICNENGSVQLHYNNVQKFQTTSTGVSVTGNVVASGDVLDRDIPCLFNSNFEDAYGTSIIVVPFNNNIESNVSTRTYNHNLTMPYAGKLTKIVMKNVSGTLSSGFTTQLFLYVNGSQQASSSEISLSNSSVTWTPTTNNTFSAGDVLTFAYQKSAIKTFGGVSFGVAIELTDYDI